MSGSSHHFRGISHYADKLMDLAIGYTDTFRCTGQKQLNKEVLAVIASIKKCQKAGMRGSFFTTEGLERKNDLARAAGTRKLPRGSNEVVLSEVVVHAIAVGICD